MRDPCNFFFVVEEDGKIIGRFERLKDACHLAAIREWRDERRQVSLIKVESGRGPAASNRYSSRLLRRPRPGPRKSNGIRKV
jgi:hypothetical protein